jgi:hypothetical protein
MKFFQEKSIHPKGWDSFLRGLSFQELWQTGYEEKGGMIMIKHKKV